MIRFLIALCCLAALAVAGAVLFSRYQVHFAVTITPVQPAHT